MFSACYKAVYYLFIFIIKLHYTVHVVFVTVSIPGTFNALYYNACIVYCTISSMY